LAKHTGLFAAVGNSAGWRGQRLLILCYHGISLSDEHEWNPGLYVTRDLFERRLKMLRDGNYRVLPLAEALELLREQKLPPRSVALTFDDGTGDFHELAYPLLRDFGFPVTVYLATFYSRFRAPVFDTLCSYLLWKGRGRRIDGTGLVAEGGEIEVPGGPGFAWQAPYPRIYRHVREAKLSAGEKDALARELARRLGIDDEPIRTRRMFYVMSPEQVAEVARNGVDIQLHTHRHRTPHDRELFAREIRDNAREIHQITGSHPEHFCYPSGDYTPEFFPWLRELGVKSATTCDTGFATSQSNQLCLPRLLDIQTLSDIEFEGWLTGASAWLPQRPNTRRAG
jgi:peptidoglycan/xylan/chitin deacetylase (PgdA/CDA1 family)